MKTYLKKRRIPMWAVHLCAWLVYVTFLYITDYLYNTELSIFQTLMAIIPYSITFYINLFLLGLYKRTWALQGIATMAVVLLIMSTFGYCYIYILMPRQGNQIYTPAERVIFFKTTTLGYIRYSAYAMLYFYIQRILMSEKNIMRLQKEKLSLQKDKVNKELEIARLRALELKSEKEKLQYEYAFLRAQINPHFLYNTLNVLFSQAMMFSQDLADNIMKLSKLMRYLLESAQEGKDKVLIQHEIEQLETLLEIHSLRFGNSRHIQYNIDGMIAGQELPPLSLLTIVENAFKYGDLKDEKNPLMINIQLLPKEIRFSCRNKKRKTNNHLFSLNIGITNLSKRLDIAFKDRYVMNAIDEANFYTFELTIKN